MFPQTNFDVSEESDMEGSWGISEEQAAKQRREFRIRFGQSDEQKESFCHVESRQLGQWLNGIWEGQNKTLKVVDVRDDDYRLHGHIKDAIHRPNDDFSPHQMVIDLKMVDVVVFYCYRSSCRGPMCAREYVRIQETKLPNQEVYVLNGGMEAFLREAEKNTRLKDLVVYEKKWVPSLGRLQRFSERFQKSDFPFLDNDHDITSIEKLQSSIFSSPSNDQPFSPLDESPRYKII